MRTTNAPSRNKRKKRIFKAAKGNVAFSYRDRKVRAREFRRLWITRLNAACRMRGRRYSEFIAALHEVGIGLDRKSLSEMAIHDAAAFDVVFAQCEKVMAKKDDERKAREAKEAKARVAAAV
jgi:large subunit ribosomal protein L20